MANPLITLNGLDKPTGLDSLYGGFKMAENVAMTQQLSRADAEFMLKDAAIDAMRIKELAQVDPMRAQVAIADRIKKIMDRGGDPSDTIGVRELLTSGNTDAFNAELDAVINGAQRAGVLEMGYKEADPYFTTVQTSKGTYKFNNRTGEQELILGPDGNPVLPVAADAEVQGSVAGARESAKLDEQLKKKPAVAEKTAEATARGKAKGDAQAQLPETIATANYSVDLLDKALNHPGLDVATGASSRLDPRNYTPGTEAYDFNVLMDQIQGRTFLAAFESLKGGGQITEIEGKKAEQAIARLNKAQSKEAFIDALNELKGIIQTGLGRAKQKAGQGPSTFTSSTGIQFTVED